MIIRRGYDIKKDKMIRYMFSNGYCYYYYYDEEDWVCLDKISYYNDTYI